MYYYTTKEEIPLEVKKDIRSSVENSVLNGCGWLEPVKEICDIEKINIDCPGIQSLVFEQASLTETEISPWWKQ